MTDLVELSVAVKANNSSGEQELHLAYSEDDGAFFFCLTGEYGGQNIQIDFDEMPKSVLEEIHAQIGLMLELCHD